MLSRDAAATWVGDNMPESIGGQANREFFECLHRCCSNVIQPRYLDRGEGQVCQTHSGCSEHALHCSMPSLFKDFVPQVRCWYVRREGGADPAECASGSGVVLPLPCEADASRGTEWDDHTNRLP
jgi:hypothetical protein